MFRKKAVYGREGVKKQKVEQRFFGPIFRPSGLLELESNNLHGIQLKYDEPRNCMSLERFWRSMNVAVENRSVEQLIVYKKGVEEPVLSYDLGAKSMYLIGRDMKRVPKGSDEDEQEVVLADIGIAEETCSKQHCVIQYRLVDDGARKTVKCYILDLESSNGTVLNGIRLPAARYIELKSGDMITLSEHGEDVDYEIIYVKN